MTVAVNPSTGEAVRLDDAGQWVPTKIAKNPQTGESLALDGAEWKSIRLPSEQPTPTQGIADYASGLRDQLFQTTSFNFGDEVRAAGRATGAQLAELIGTKTDDESWLESYRRAKGEIDRDLEDFQTRNPKASLAANVAGGFMMAPGAAAAAAPSLLRATGSSAATGGVTGAAAGAGAGDTLEERGRNAVAGGAAGALLGTAAPLATSALGTAGRAVQNMLGWQDPKRTASALLRRTLQREGLTPEEAVASVDTMRAQSGGADVSLADVGDLTGRLARTVETVPSAGSKELMEFLTDRQAGSGDRVLSGIRRTAGKGEQNLTEKALRDARQTASKPLYDQAFAHGPVYDDYIGRMIGDPIVKQGIRKGLEIQRLEALADNVPFDPMDSAVVGFDDAGDAIIDQVPNMRLLDAAKKGLDAIIDESRDPLTMRVPWTERLRAVDSVRKSLVSRLDELNPDYAAARAAWAGPSASLDAVNAGRSFMRGDIEDVDSLFRRLAPGDRDFFLIGLSRELRDMVDKRPTALSDATQRIMRPEVRNRLDVFLGREQSAALNDLLSVEKRMKRTYQTAGGGSPTGRIAAEQDDAQQATVGFLTDLLSAGPRSAITNAASRGVNRARGLNEATADELARMLTMWSPDDLRRLVGRLEEDRLRDLAARHASSGAGRAARAGLVTAGAGAMEDRR